VLDKAEETLCVQAGIALAIIELTTIKDHFKTIRLQLDKAIKSEKENRKQRYIEVSAKRVREYIETLNEGLPLCYEVQVPAALKHDLAAAIKGLKTLTSMQNALDGVVLKYESEANQACERNQQQARQASEQAGLGHADDINAARIPSPIPSGETAQTISKFDLNNRLAPLRIGIASLVDGLVKAARAGDWKAVKQALINHIEQAIPA